MENEIKVGEYIRTKDGVIAEVTYVDGLMIDTDNDVFDLDNLSMMEIPVEYANEYIVKHSNNLIDIIEEGDYVNGEIVDKIFNPRFLSFGELPYIITANNKYEPQEIEEIVTKEMMESISYKVTKMW